MIEAGQVRRRHPTGGVPARGAPETICLDRNRDVPIRDTVIGPATYWPGDPRMGVVLITYESELPPDEVAARFRERSGKYREMEGLVQKLYFRDEATGRFGGIYVFDSEASRDALFETDIHATLREAYAVKGDVDISTFHLEFPLYDSVNLATAG